MTQTHVGEMIRLWRRKRRLSQQDLAESAEVSTRHLSCVENGKALPSREMLLVLGSALDLPLRERNLMLMAAGHPAAYHERTGLDPGVANIIRVILDNAEPNPALACDMGYDLVDLNSSMAALATWLGVAPGQNLIESVFTELAPWIANYDEVATAMIDRLHREALHTGRPELEALYERVKRHAPPPTWEIPPVAIPLTLRRDDVEIRMFTTLTSIGTPTDVAASELRIETYYPMDDASRVALDALPRP